MKKFYNLVLVAGLSLVAIGAGAQQVNQSKVAVKRVRAYAPKTDYMQKMHTRKANAANQYLFLDYAISDSVFKSTLGDSYSGSPSIGAPGYIQDFNMHYSLADTGSPGPTAGTGTYNNTLIHSVAVVYDTLLDAFSGTGTSYVSGSNGTVTVDTLMIPIGQQNVTGTNDTLVIQITGVTKGAPNSTVLWSQTIIQDTGLSGKGKNFLYGYNLFLAPNLVVTGPFAVNIEYFGNQRDSAGFLYGFPTTQCSGNGIPDTTFVGAPITADKLNATFTAIAGTYPITANSFLTGWQYITNTGTTDNVITMPSAPTYPKNYYLGGDDYFGQQCTNGSATVVSSNGYQDIAIYANISVSPAGIANVSANGLNVSQNYPNPTGSATQINYSVTKSSDVTFTVNDITGREIMNNTYSNVTPGQHVVNVNTANLNDGIYFYTFNVNGNKVTKKMVVTK